MTNVGASLKTIIYVKKILLGILLYVVTKMVKYLPSITDNSVIMCDEIIDADV